MKPVHSIVNNHALTSFFSVNLIEKSEGNITLELSAKNNAAEKNQQGALGCIVDCAARLAGYSALGQCFLSECEINVHTLSRTQDFIVNATIAAANKQHATYCCEIYSVQPLTNLLVAESQGTLLKTKSTLRML